MVNAYKCDRCGAFYEFYGENKENYGNTVQTFYKNEAGNGQEYNADKYDLCPDCMESFKRWLDPHDQGYIFIKNPNIFKGVVFMGNIKTLARVSEKPEDLVYYIKGE